MWKVCGEHRRQIAKGAGRRKYNDRKIKKISFLKTYYSYIMLLMKKVGTVIANELGLQSNFQAGFPLRQQNRNFCISNQALNSIEELSKERSSFLNDRANTFNSHLI